MAGRPAQTPAPPAPRSPGPLLAWMEALADATRLRILRALERGELSVLELCEALAVPQSTASRHLKHLADRGWIRARREGTQTFYGLAPELDPRSHRASG